MKRFLLPLLFLCSIPASATTYYFADCGAGKDGACVAGSDAALGTSSAVPYRTSTKFQAVFNAAKPGDQLLLAKGGAWDAVAVTLRNAYSGTDSTHLATMVANPVIVDSYTPSWGTGVAKPRLNSLTTGTVDNPDILLSFKDNYATTYDGGFVVRNLDFESAGSYHVSIGINVVLRTSNIVFDNLTINGFGWGGFGCSGQASLDRNRYPYMITLKNSAITNNGKTGIGAFGCSNFVVDKNTLDNNGFDDSQILTTQDISRNHQMYITGTDANDGSVTSGVIIRNNTMTNSSVCPAVGTNGYNSAHTCAIGQCSAAVIVGHDWASDFVIENNTISQVDGTSGGGCWGIGYGPANGGYSEATFRLVVRGNTLINLGNTAITTAACQNCLFENNVVLWGPNAMDNIGDGDCFMVKKNSVSASPGATYQNQNVVIRNNTCYYAKTGDVSRGISVRDVGTGHIVTNNLIVFDASGTNIAAYCVDTTGLTMAAFTAFDYNQCFHYANWTPTQSLAMWQGTPGTPDIHSLTSNPQLIGKPSQASPGNVAIGAGSPARGAGSSTYKAPRDRTACARPSPASIGAYEYFASACGTKPAASPTQLR